MMGTHLVGVWSPDEETHYGMLLMEVLPRIGETLAMYDQQRKIQVLTVTRVYHSYLDAQDRLRHNPMDEHAKGRIYLSAVPEDAAGNLEFKEFS